MSAIVASSSARDEAVYGRLFREGRAEVLAQMRREFPSTSAEDVEDAASLALLEMVRRRQLSEWRSGAIGQWAKMTRYRLVDQARRTRLHEQKARLRPASEVLDARAPQPLEQIEAALSAWRVVELMAQMPPRAATYVQLQLIERKRRAEVLAATGWSAKQYEKAQAAAKRALHATLGDLEGTAECEEQRHLIDARELGEDLPERSRSALHAHIERCGSCRIYASEARRTMHGVAPLLTLAWSGAASGGGLALLGGSAVPSGLLVKGAAILSAGAIGIGGVYAFTKHDDHRGGSRASSTIASQPSVARRSHGTATVPPPHQAPSESGPRGKNDALGLNAAPPAGATMGRERASLRPVGASPSSVASPEAAFGLGAPVPPTPPAPAPGCAPGELGC